ncbi:polysaccharide biosynthesis/export family protein [Sphingomicrobium sediminis]|uniref:Polysaccharide export protein n=1 Tax=Sphingomicrobium sediminis TaxID=2950949 RepID=A0A9X2J239_9SPHN|nr:polysaccharide biosynthesis/export family protein [Sphingomicrobium sediminis]MCM8556645.1 polysaccharide export protein [Sphingomicrobium sediminis]
MNFKTIATIMLAICLAACGGTPRLSSQSTAVTVTDELPAPDVSETAVDLTEYRIGPTDEISVSVFNADELNREAVIDASGQFAMPLIGVVQAGGKTPSELSTEIADKLRGRFIKDPQVVVNLTEVRANVVTVDGAVTQPGIYPVIGNMTLLRAIATARGASTVADETNVVVFRTVNGEKMAAMFNLNDIRGGRVADPRVYGNDLVVVGESGTRRFLRDTGGGSILGRFIPVL